MPIVACPASKALDLNPAAPGRNSTAMNVFIKTSLLLIGSVALAAAAGPQPDFYSALDFGAKADGKTDDTASFQKALDAAGQSGGGIVYAPRGNYFFPVI